MSDDNRALLRALRIERETRRLYARRLRRLLGHRAYAEFSEICRTEAFARCDVPGLAKVTTETRDA